MVRFDEDGSECQHWAHELQVIEAPQKGREVASAAGEQTPLEARVAGLETRVMALEGTRLELSDASLESCQLFVAREDASASEVAPEPSDAGQEVLQLREQLAGLEGPGELALELLDALSAEELGAVASGLRAFNEASESPARIVADFLEQLRSLAIERPGPGEKPWATYGFERFLQEGSAAMAQDWLDLPEERRMKLLQWLRVIAPSGLTLADDRETVSAAEDALAAVPALVQRIDAQNADIRAFTAERADILDALTGGELPAGETLLSVTRRRLRAEGSGSQQTD
jgi:hypothetical protein